MSAKPSTSAPVAGGGPTVYVTGVHIGSSNDYLDGAIAETIESSGILSAVKPNDNVLILPATNSPDEYPATVYPPAVSILVRKLEGLGAKVTTGCMSGIEFTCPTADGEVMKGTSLECAEKSRLTEAGVEFTPFEKRGYYLFDDQKLGHWPYGFYVSNLVKEADHIFVASRISTHGMAGITLGIKNLMGFLSMPSRVELHDAGMMPWFIHANAHGSGIKSRPVPQKDFPERIAELGLAMEGKFRGQLTVGTKLQTTMGPNAYLLEFPFGQQNKWLRLFKSHVYTPETGLVIASSDIVASDAVASAFLTDAYVNHTPRRYKFWQWVLRLAHSRMNRLGKFGVYQDPVMAQALSIGLGSKVGALEAVGVPEPLLNMLKEAVLP